MSTPDPQLLDGIYCRRADVVHVEVDHETVVFQRERESLTVLDQVGTVIWTLLDGTVSLGTLAEELAEAYRAPLPQVQHDVLELIVQLKNDELLAADHQL